jgi:hypothetical protein
MLFRFGLGLSGRTNSLIVAEAVVLRLSLFVNSSGISPCKLLCLVPNDSLPTGKLSVADLISGNLPNGALSVVRLSFPRRSGGGPALCSLFVGFDANFAVVFVGLCANFVVVFVGLCANLAVVSLGLCANFAVAD